MLADFVQSMRRLRTERTITAAAILIAALAIGSSAAVLAALHRVLVAPIDYPAPQGLVRIVGRSSGVTGETNISPPDFRDMRRRLTTVRTLAAVSPFSPQVSHANGAEPELVNARLISSRYFEALGVRVTGREFTEAEEQPAARVVVLGERWWRSRLAGRRDAVGSTIVLNGVGHTVVGIAEDREQVFGQPDVWLPMQLPSEQIRALRVAAVVGRLADADSGTHWRPRSKLSEPHCSASSRSCGFLPRPRAVYGNRSRRPGGAGQCQAESCRAQPV